MPAFDPAVTPVRGLGAAVESGFGEGSPLARIHDLDGDVLLLGAGHGSDTSLHLAEYVIADESDFMALGEAFDATGAVVTGRVGAAEARSMRQRELVAFGVSWMVENRRR